MGTIWREHTALAKIERGEKEKREEEREKEKEQNENQLEFNIFMALYGYQILVFLVI